jgi:hypothetical protein
MQGFATHAAMFLETMIIQYAGISGIGGEVTVLGYIA